ncbi:MAG: hypothetical protein ACYDCK_04710 [Thermoplasmatota archaeon]
MKVAELFRTYVAINDPKAPKWTMKFAVVGGVLALVAAGSALYLALPAPSASANAVAAQAPSANPDGSSTVYVGYDPGTFDPAKGYDATAAENLLAQWETDHPSAHVDRIVPQHAGTLLIGYTVTFTQS